MTRNELMIAQIDAIEERLGVFKRQEREKRKHRKVIHELDAEVMRLDLKISSLENQLRSS